MSKYDTLVTILDNLRKEAPTEYKRYYPLDNDQNGINYARGRAFIHLFLKVKFGMLEFKDREQHITDEKQDAGIDAYFFDEESKLIYFIQSKFRGSEKNFSDKEILLSELLQMDIERILTGEQTDHKGVPFNEKIKKLIRGIQNIPDPGRWDYRVIILANLSANLTKQQIQKVTGGYITEVYDHERTYNELLFPVVQGTFHNPKELKIYIDLSNASASSSEITYTVFTEKINCDITVLFVPTSEIAKAMYKYRNSILKYNPRSFLELSNNDVNKDIAASIKNIKTNEFALFNNGITMLSSDTNYNKRIGQRDRAQLIISQPQIINGGQTAFTLSRVYEDILIGKVNSDVFNGKEVLLKVITLPPDSSEDEQLSLIESISKATNKQSPIDEADRRSNDSIQIKLQNYLFQEYGYFYERKRGEFADGVREGYIHRTQLIDREQFLRLCKCCDIEPEAARRASRKQLFEIQSFNKTLNDTTRFREYVFSFRCWQILSATEKGFAKNKNNKYGIAQYGNGLLYGKYAVLSACMLSYNEKNILETASEIVENTLKKWQKFEAYITSLSTNNSYFRTYADEETGIEKQELNFDNYYKGKTVSGDIKKFFGVQTR